MSGFQFRRIDQTQQKRLAVAPLAVVKQLVLAGVALTGPVRQHVFQFEQPFQMVTNLKITPAERVSQLTLGEADEIAT